MISRFLFILLICAQVANANQTDLDFISNLVTRSSCTLPPEFANEFSNGIDRLEKINPALANEIRSNSYTRQLDLKCDLPADSEYIYFALLEQTIHLRETAGSDWKTPASFFHEFLHFVGVKIDNAYHSAPNMENIVEVDNVYACHLAVFPKILDYAKLDPSRLDAANARCSSATVEQ